MEAGQRIGDKIRLVEPLGRGGMGAVWLAHHEGLAAPVAVKVVATEGRDGQNLARLRREARLAAKLSCPHVVRIFDVGEHDGAPFVVMERLEGRSLAERLDEGPISAAELVPWLRQLAAALAAAHEAGIVHRDVKPGNVFLVATGGEPFVKLLDFGLARGPDPASPLTRSGAVMGTIHYMSPEQLRAGTVDHRVDLWALAVVAYRALTGTLPFPGASVSEVAMAVERGTFAPPSSLVDELGPEVDAFFKRALCRNPRLRFDGAQELVAALAAALAAPKRGSNDGVDRPDEVDSSADTVTGPLDAIAPPEVDGPFDPAPDAGPRRASWLLAAVVAAGLVGVAWSLHGVGPGDEPSPAPPEVAQPAPEPSPAPIPVTSAAPPAPVPTPVSAPVPMPVSAPVPTSPAPRPAPKAAVDCSQPFVVDDRGDYHPRPECLR